jgi:hypothetical protein
MKKWFAITMVLTVCLMTGGVCVAADDSGGGSDVELELIVNARPASLLVDVDGKKFGVDGNTMSQVYMMPNVSAGIGMEMGDLYLDATLGAGMIINDRFRSFIIEAGVALNYAVTDSYLVGPRASLLYFVDPEYTEDDSADFDAGAGFLLGLQMALGDKISYVVSVDLLATSLDAEAQSGVVLTDDELDMFGLAFQFGVRGEF